MTCFKPLFLLWLSVILFVIAPNLAHAQDTIYYAKKRKAGFNQAEYEQKSYYLSLLKMVLEKTRAEFGDYSLAPADTAMINRRALTNLALDKGISIVWSEPPAKLDPELEVIDIPLIMKHENYLALVIREEDKAKFSAIDSSHQLKKLTAGRIAFANDIERYKRNGYSYTTGAATYNNLFVMLQHKRIDYFPIILYGAYLNVHKYQGLIVEDTLALNYPKGIYYIVRKDNVRLKQRLIKGFKLAQQDGSFAKHFASHSMMKPYQHFDPSSRRVFTLQ